MKKQIIIIVGVFVVLGYTLYLNLRKSNDVNDYEVSDQDRKASYQLCDSAEKFIQDEQYDIAGSLLLKAIKKNIYCAAAYNDIAGIKWKKHEPFDTVVFYFSKSIELNPLNITPYGNLTNYYVTSKHYQNAIAEAENLISIVYIHTKDDTLKLSRVYSMSAEANNGLKRYKEAINDAMKAEELDSLNDDAYLELGIAHHYLGYYKRCIKEETIALQLNPKHAAGHKYNARGISYYKVGEYDLALKDYDSSLLSDNTKAIGHFNRGLLYIDMNMKYEALRDMKIADSLGAPDAKSYIKNLQN